MQATTPASMQPAWIDLDGEMQLLPDVARAEIVVPTLSHDGRRALVFDPSVGGVVWAHDAVTEQRRSLENIDPGFVVLSDLPDGQLLAINPLTGPGSESVVLAPSGASEVIHEGFVQGISRDGRPAVAMRKVDDDGSAVIEALDLEGTKEPVDLGVRTQFVLAPTFSSISPDNRWVLVHSSEGGHSALLVVATRGGRRR